MAISIPIAGLSFDIFGGVLLRAELHGRLAQSMYLAPARVTIHLGYADAFGIICCDWHTSDDKNEQKCRK